MTIRLLQNNFNTEYTNSSFKAKERPSYLDAKEEVQTEGLVRPLPPQGHLVNDNLGNSFKYFFKDIGYNLKSVKDGFNGTANDHQLGRLNDVGIATAGILIATYLASKTSNPKVRLMEYVGLGSFLTAMALYPKLVINTPAKIIHGYDFDKEYIDDQGRKKSVMQDPNYVPYDMYLGEIPEEDISKIGDKMGIPQGIKNRNDLVREQMRKVATQNNTLWMLTACVTPALSGLMCYGIENYIAQPLVENSKIASVNRSLSEMIKKTSSMADNLNIESIKSNQLSKNVESILSNYKGHEIPKQELELVIEMLSEDLFANTSAGIKEDVLKLVKTSYAKGSESFSISNELLDSMISEAKDLFSKNSKLDDILVPTKEELEQILNKVKNEKNDLNIKKAFVEEDIVLLKEEISKLITEKFKTNTDIPREFLESKRNSVVECFSKAIKKEQKLVLTDESYKKIIDLAKVLGEFKANQKVLQKCSHSLMEHSNGSILANSYGKFEKVLLDVLGLKHKDLKKIKESETYAKEILDKKLSEIAKDEARYQKAIEKLGNVISDLEIKLNGNNESKSRLLDLINATENNYNNTAKRLAKTDAFKNTIDRLVKEDVNTLNNAINSKQELFDFLDGIVESVYKDIPDWKDLDEAKRIEYLKENTKGVGSSKKLEISRLLERYQGAKSSQYRLIQSFDVYKRAVKPENFCAKQLAGKDPELVDTVIREAKSALLSATASDHTMKLNYVNNPEFYKLLALSTWAEEGGEFYSTKQKGLVDEVTKKALGKNNSILKGNVLDRYQYFITRFRNIVCNSTVDFTSPRHILNKFIRNHYTMDEKTRMAVFNLVGQTPVDMVKNAAAKKYSTNKWLRTVASIAGSIVGVALLAQFSFGKISNAHNLKKQVNNDTDN